MPELQDLSHESVADAVARAVVDAVAKGGDTEAIVARALTAVRANLGLGSGSGVNTTASSTTPVPGPGAPGRALAASNGSRGTRSVVSEADVLAAARAGQRELRIARKAIVTALARDVARDTGVALVEEV